MGLLDQPKGRGRKGILREFEGNLKVGIISSLRKLQGYGHMSSTIKYHQRQAKLAQSAVGRLRQSSSNFWSLSNR